MNKSYLKIVQIVSFLFLCSSCDKNYKRTVKVCDDKLYVELYNINQAGVDAHYLTDSTNFRLFVGQLDNEHENYSYNCDGDTVTIQKTKDVSTAEQQRIEVLSLRKLSISRLKIERKFE